MTPTVVAIVLLSAMIHAVWSFFIKGSRDPLAFNVLQGLPLVVVFVAMLFLVEWSNLSARVLALVGITGIAHAVYLYGLSLAFAEGDLSLVYPIARSTPAFLPLVAVPLTGERLSWAGGIGIAMVVVGMWTVQIGRGGASPPDAGRDEPITARLASRAVRYAYLALAASIAYGVLDKQLVLAVVEGPSLGAVPPALFVYFAVWFSMSVVFLPVAWVKMSPGSLRETARREWKSALLASSIGIVGYSLILKALESAPASYVVAVRQSSVLFVLVLSIVLLRERPGPLRIAGAAATVAGVGLIASAG